MKTKFTIALLAFASFSAQARDVEMSPNLIGGTVANPADWPASPWVGNCSATLIGEQTLLVAAHCTANGATKNFTIGTTRYAAKCEHHTSYRQNHRADWALCKVNAKVENVPFESLAKPEEVSCQQGKEFLLTGYGCTVWSNNIDGKFRTGTAKTIGCPSGSNYYTTTRGRVALCKGDSGGAAYTVMADGSRRIIGVNSRSNTIDTSYVSSTFSNQFLSWANSWANRQGVRICGLHDDAIGCQGQDPNPDGDCSAELARVEKAELDLAAAETALQQCQAGS